MSQSEVASVGTPPKLIDSIPDPQLVRERLGQTLREAKILRQLLKVSERAAREKTPRPERQVACA